MMTLFLIVAIGAAFTNPEAVEQALDNSPQAARVAIEKNVTQEEADAIEEELIPTPTLDQQEADLKTARTLVLKTTDDEDKIVAIAAIDKMLAAIETEKPPAVEEPSGSIKDE